MSTLKDYYERFRRNRTPALRALQLAHENFNSQRPLYEIPYKRTLYYNPPAEDGLAWVENVSQGLRFTGFCDKISNRIGHSGWYIDDFQDEKYQGVVYQMPARKGVPQYVVGYADPWNDDCARLDFRNRYDDKLEAAYAADKIAEKEAEESREYNEAYQAGRDWDEAGAELSYLRKGTISLLQAIKAERSRGAAEVICNALLSQIRGDLHEYSKLKKKRAELVDRFNSGWQSKLWSAFNDGAGEIVL